MTMAPTGSKWRLDRPLEGPDTDPAFPALPPVAVAPPVSAPVPRPPLMCRTFLPDEYEPKYPYPLLVVFHPHGGCEGSALDLVPRLSRRNFVGVSIRGPELLGVREDGRLACGWGRDDSHTELVNEYVFKAVESVRQACHVHSERVFLVGVCEGAAAAYRAAFTLADKVAGLVVLNGAMPRPTGGVPLFRPTALRHLPVFVGHGVANARVPFPNAVRDHKLLYAAGADVRMHRYVTNNRLHPDMFKDVNRWVIDQISAETARFAG
jgi:phospholipase/carboxylesterase